MSGPGEVGITCVDADGRAHAVRARIGLSVMEALREADLLVGECGGALACATCHVWVEPRFANAFEPPSDAEEEMLDVAFNLAPTSRLSCQLTVSPDSDGMVLSLPRKMG